MSTFVNGYIICHENKCLTKNLFWYPHESIENAYVFPWWQADDVLEMAEKWKLQPTHIFAATYDSETGITTVGERYEKKAEEV